MSEELKKLQSVEVEKMTAISLDEAKKIELDILLYFADFCEKHNLRYFLAYGTLIGAVRHKGFIPWDDDIDVNMPRTDYNKLLQIFNAEKDNETYYLVNPQESMARHTMAKIIDTRTVKIETGIKYSKPIGIDIDIFPLDGIPENESVYEKWYRKLTRVYRHYWYKCLKWTKGSWKINVRVLAFKPFAISKKNALKKAMKLHDLYPYEGSKYVGAIESSVNGKGNRCRKECFDDFIIFEFEKYKFKCPVGYHEVLTNIYGDYMKLPPVEKQVTHHKNNVFWRE